MHMTKQIKTDALMQFLFKGNVEQKPVETILHTDGTIELKFSKRITLTNIQKSIMNDVKEHGYIELERYIEIEQNEIVHACAELVEMNILEAIEFDCLAWQFTEVGEQIYDNASMELQRLPV